ncbi:hypothetical protein ACJX0J_038816, partial [Zea mays]
NDLVLFNFHMSPIMGQILGDKEIKYCYSCSVTSLWAIPYYLTESGFLFFSFPAAAVTSMRSDVWSPKYAILFRYKIQIHLECINFIGLKFI